MCERVGVLYAGQADRGGPGRASSSRTPGIPTRWRCCAACRAWGCERTSTGSTRSPARCRRSASRSPAACTPSAARSPRPLPSGASADRAGGGRTRRRCFYHEEVPQIPPRGRPPRRGAGRASGLRRRPSEGGRPGQGVRVRREPGGCGRRRRHRGRPRRGARPGRRVRERQDVARKCIVGLLDPSAGTIEFDQSDVTRSSRDREARRQLQMVFQNPDNALNPSHTVRAILRRSLELAGRCPGQGQAGRGDERPGPVGAARAAPSRRPAGVALRRPEAAGRDRAVVRREPVAWCCATSRPRRSTSRCRPPS